ncbi:hypothetical protein [Actinokineospora guangxiensis]|uniref:hypothetical protein n=1 Tax=Actinokineospora guangxiensis TaxID=1490288 RepID=UPI003672C7B2
MSAELARWCQLTAMIAGRRALPDRERVAQVLTAMQATAIASTRLLELLADDVDPHTTGAAPAHDHTATPDHPDRAAEPRIFRHEPGENAEVLTELAAMSAAENLRDAMLMASGLSYSIGRALEHMDRSERPPSDD